MKNFSGALVILFVLIFSNANAQQLGVGINAGMNMNMLQFSKFTQSPSFDLNPRFGYGAGLDIELRFNAFGIGTGVNYSVINFNYLPHFDSAGSIKVNFSLSDLSVPLYMALTGSIFGILDMKGKLGLTYNSYTVSGFGKQYLNDQGGTVTIEDVANTSIQTAGILAGVAFRPLRKINHFSIGADFNYSLGLSRIYSINSNVKQGNYNQALQTAIQFRPSYIYIYLQYNFEKKKV